MVRVWAQGKGTPRSPPPRSGELTNLIEFRGHFRAGLEIHMRHILHFLSQVRGRPTHVVAEAFTFTSEDVNTPQQGDYQYKYLYYTIYCIGAHDRRGIHGEPIRRCACLIGRGLVSREARGTHITAQATVGQQLTSHAVVAFVIGKHHTHMRVEALGQAHVRRVEHISCRLAQVGPRFP